MTYFPVDDQLSFHPKVLAAGNAPLGLWVRAGAWCKNHVSGGFVPTQAARSMGSAKEARALVDAGLWEEVLGGYLFHDWDRYGNNRTGAQEEQARDEKREKDRIRQAEWRARHNVTEAVTDPVTESVTSRARGPVPVPVPVQRGLREQSSVPETSRAKPEEDESELPHIDRAIALGVDYRRVRDRLTEQAGDRVPPDLVERVIRECLARAKPRTGDRTGLVLHSLRTDWAEWSRLVFAHAS